MTHERSWRALALVLASVVSSCAHGHRGRGLVLRVDTPAEEAGDTRAGRASRLVVSHDAIPGFMEAMVMPVAVRRGSALPRLQPGDRIAFTLRVRGNETVVDRVRVVSAAPIDRGLLASPAASTLITVGAPVPDFELVDQAGAPLRLSSLAGRVVAVNFIYTRCPLPDYCPRMMAYFRAVRDRFADRMGKDLTLLTISFDPQYDTPARLAEFAGTNRAGGPGWHLLTGPREAIDRVCQAFGMEYWPEEGLFTHTLQTAVIDRRGRLAATVEGKDYTAKQVGDLIEMVLMNQ